jgi:ribose/xylose/arabinose/galactoside ABC-type transport system permease subunit/ABC-type sugar transport system substrate-binding protein
MGGSGPQESPFLAWIGSARGLLAMVLAVELVVFSITGTNFLTVANGFEVVRLSVEIGLLALVMTPVILTGGIDLSVGSLMGLSAVVFGKLWRDAGLSIGAATVVTLLVGATAGLLNGWLITRWRLPALIVTLGSYSLFRGLAEGLTGGVDNFTQFPASFIAWGQGYLGGVVPTQLPVLVVVALALGWLVHGTRWGRTWSAIGYNAEGARYAGVRVEPALRGVYVLSGVISSLAALIYVAHLGQAKADAGTGYELLAITAVVLGGTSIFGGRGSVLGTLMGLLAIAVLQNGLRLSDQPAELAGLLSGLILLLTIGLEVWWPRWSTAARVGKIEARSKSDTEDWQMKTWQVLALCGSILIAAGLIAGSNRAVVQALQQHAVHSASSASPAGNAAGSNGGANPAATIGSNGGGPQSTGPAKRLTVAMMPKTKGNAYFIACKKGADEAAEELGINLIWDGPTDPDPAKQNEVIDTWITRGVDVLAVACENRIGISSVLRKARERGIKVVTWDADAETDARDFFVNQATPEGIGFTLMDTAAEVLGGEGEFAIITASLTAANMIEWQQRIEQRRAEKYPQIKLAALRPCDDKQPRAFDETTNVLNAFPNVKLFMAICTPAVPGAAEAVKQAGRSDVSVIGLGLPNDNKRYVHEGITKAVILWNTADLGYLAVHAAKAVHDGSLKTGATSFTAGRLGDLTLEGDNIILGKPFAFTKDNIDQFDF